MCLSARLSLAFQGTFAITVAYLLRANFGFAIMCMTKTSFPVSGNSSLINNNTTDWPLLPYDANDYNSTSELVHGRPQMTEIDRSGDNIDPEPGSCVNFMSESSHEDVRLKLTDFQAP